jgi:hypothetical protein
MIEDVLFIMARLLFLLLVFILIGRPLLLFLRGRVEFLKNFDLVQELIFDVYLGATILYIIALLPLHLFTFYVLVTVLALCSALNLLQLTGSFKHRKIRRAPTPLVHRRNLLEQPLVMILFLISLGIQIIPISTLVLGPIHDNSLHALFAELILENGQIPATHQPYLSAAIIYPQGAQVVFAFASLILGVSTPISVLQVTPLFGALTVLAAYHFGKSLDKRKHAGLALAFVFTFISMWPTYVTWGGNTMVMAFPLFILAATFLAQATSPDHMLEKHNTLSYILAGLCFGYLASLHISLFVVVACGWLMLLLYKLLRHLQIADDLKRIAIIFGISLILISPFVYRFALYYDLPGQNIGLPADTASPEVAPLPLINERLTLSTVGGFLLDLPFQYNISPYPLTRGILIVLSIALFGGIFYKALIKRRLTELETVVSILMVVSVALLFTDTINVVPTTSLRGSFALYICLMLLLGSFSLSLWKCLAKNVTNFKSLKALALMILVLGVIYAPFVYYKFEEDASTLRGLISIDAVATQDDYDMMAWMRTNLTKDAIILVNPFDAGLFIPALSQRIAVYPFSAYDLSASYANATLNLSNGTLDSAVYRYLDAHNITYVYVGPRFSRLAGPPATSGGDFNWNPWLFLDNPNFGLAKKIGDAYLFKYRPNNTETVLEDKFDYPVLDYGGWKVTLLGDGVARVSLTKGHSVTGSGGLLLYAKSEGEPCMAAVWRGVFVSDSSNVTMFLNSAVAGYGSKDSVMLVIANLSRTSFARANLTSGLSQFNLTKMWEDQNNIALPESFLIEILSYNTDGVPTAVFINSISITAGETH